MRLHSAKAQKPLQDYAGLGGANINLRGMGYLLVTLRTREHRFAAFGEDTSHACVVSGAASVDVASRLPVITLPRTSTKGFRATFDISALVRRALLLGSPEGFYVKRILAT